MKEKIAEYDKIKELVLAMVKAINPQRIYLFGSFAKGLQKDSSDYDFYIIVDDNSDVYNLWLQAYMAVSERTRPVDIVVKDETRFNERKTWLYSVERNVVSDGVVMYER